MNNIYSNVRDTWGGSSSAVVVLVSAAAAIIPNVCAQRRQRPCRSKITAKLGQYIVTYYIFSLMLAIGR